MLTWHQWPLLQERAYEWGGWHPMWGVWGLGGMAVMLCMMLLFWGLVITALVVSIRWLIRQGSGGRPDAALEILRQRYARGEINKDEFDAKKRDLGA
jgi:putative membrane protein